MCMELQMKKIEKFGAFIVEGWPFMLAIVILVGLIAVGIGSCKTVTLSEKQFKCISTSPDGIGSKCDVYERRVR